MADKQAAAPKNKAIRDSEGLPVVSIKDETETEESVNKGAKEAYEAELAADEADAAKAAAKQEEENKVAFEKFLAER